MNGYINQIDAFVHFECKYFVLDTSQLLAEKLNVAFMVMSFYAFV